VRQPGWDYVLKCDDDTYVAAARLAAYDPGGHDYLGAEWRPGVDYGSGGAGYLLSRRAAQTVTQSPMHHLGAEDLLVGQVLRAAGVKLTIEPRLIPWGTEEKRPKAGNDLITAHKFGPELWAKTHEEVSF
jgi:hypothetical protein